MKGTRAVWILVMGWRFVVFCFKRETVSFSFSTPTMREGYHDCVLVLPTLINQFFLYHLINLPFNSLHRRFKWAFLITCCLSSVCPCTKQASSDCVDFKSLRSNNTFKFRYAFISTKFMKKFVSIDIFVLNLLLYF